METLTGDQQTEILRLCADDPSFKKIRIEAFGPIIRDEVIPDAYQVYVRTSDGADYGCFRRDHAKAPQGYNNVLGWMPGGRASLAGVVALRYTP